MFHEIADFLGSLSNAEVQTDEEDILNSALPFLASTDKHLAQTAAIFLLTCGGTLGEQLLSEAIATQDLPHKKLIRAMQKLLTSPSTPLP